MKLKSQQQKSRIENKNNKLELQYGETIRRKHKYIIIVNLY